MAPCDCRATFLQGVSVKRRAKGSASDTDRLQLFHQEDGAAALDLAGDPAMQMRRHASDAARENFAALGDKFFQHIRVFVINRFDRNVDSPPRHGAIRASKGGTTLGSFGLHGWLLRFPMESMPLQEWIVFLFLEPIGRARALLVSRGHVTRRRLAERFRLGAFQSNNFLGHFFCYSFASAGATASSSSASPPSSSVSPKSDVTDCRTREALFCFSSCDWH
jgi:hypothetical protein